ncbi:tRNA (5-methylaminomethyl-2-thiouridine)(34)-methyltransferase MnmD [Wenxinia marina]|uniref:MnmC-like methyltransferase domain-containing protein n=1 Tax=Wenxinia marina DSM 24838 TaxID=1123501 RepID=A0A0D0NRH6_9RHOB|nr:tRNA (5-methylaminomethyl-2-thiouridine)(34)-methyltransferase MnmD [Wenxinia marina]KIQ70825.1 hypothetical protein Wenmar_00199 [Wenxinia marina DSM 24838]GGL57016.1 FAD-dependent oxidoreductase [Wenxinia marina]
MTGDGPDLDWRDGRVPVSRRYGDPYFSFEDGLAETRHVFLAGNGLPGRIGPGFAVAELGFGTGLNLLALLAALPEPPPGVGFTTFEAAPLDAETAARAHASFPELAEVSADLLAAWGALAGGATVRGVRVRVVVGDARETVPAWDGAADAWFLDGFAPARNPELWDPALLASVASHMRPGGTLATYSAAGAVRRTLAGAGLVVERRAGYGRKRHMTVAAKPGHPT